jgi:hypothetical protein
VIEFVFRVQPARLRRPRRCSVVSRLVRIRLDRRVRLGEIQIYSTSSPCFTDVRSAGDLNPVSQAFIHDYMH